MSQGQVFDSAKIPFADDPRLPGILVQTLVSGKSGSAASMAIAEVAPGGAIPTHQHPAETEVFLVLSGEGFIQFGDRREVMRPGIAGTIPPGTVHHVENPGSETLRILAVHTPPTR